MVKSNEDRLKVPAFLRKLSIRKKAAKPLLLTALDRKKAGIKVGETKKKRKRVAAGTSSAGVRRRSLVSSSLGSQVFDEPLLDDISAGHTVMVRRRACQQAGSRHDGGPVFEDGREFSRVGRITHYFDGIQVGVIELSAPVRTGEYILFEIEGGLCGQWVMSMQYNKRDITLGKTGMDIGLKLSGVPVLQGKVFKF